VLAALVTLTGCGSAGSSGPSSAPASPSGTASITTGLTKVDISSYQALPPPNGKHHAVLTSRSDLSSFAGEVASDHIGLTSRKSAGGCAGGTEFTVVMSRQNDSAVTLTAYSCGGSITGTMSGDVRQFISYLKSLL
jgi:hypothetical protein